MMHSLRPSSLFRPSSRPTSPSPVPTPTRSDTPASGDRAPRAITKLSLTTFRRPSPAPSPLPTAAIVQDGSYLDVLGLKLSEAVSKALAQPPGPAAPSELLNGRRPVPAGRGQALGSLIATELNASRDNPHLRKAILRCLQRPLSTLLTKLSAYLLPLLSSPAFLDPPAPTTHNPSLNPTQNHAIALANFAGELLESFDDLGLGLDNDPRGDGLKGVRDTLTSTVMRVVNPLSAGIRDDLLGLISGLENTPTTVAPAAVAPKAVPLTRVGSGGAQHPSIVALQAITPVYSRALSRYFVTTASQSSLATILISLIWHGLSALAYRVPPSPTPPTSPFMASRKVRSTTPPTTPPSSRFMLKLPPSRPPSPPVERTAPSVLTDARMLYDLLSTLPRPSAEKERTRLAREAVDEAFDGLRAFINLLELTQTNSLGKDTADLVKQLGEVTADLPTLVALPVLLNNFVFSDQSAPYRNVASMVGLSVEEYRQGCLTGYGRAEECTAAVGRKVLQSLEKEVIVTVSPHANAVKQWLEAQVAAVEL